MSNSNLWVADPRQVTFLCVAKEKLPKERRTRMARRPPRILGFVSVVARASLQAPGQSLAVLGRAIRGPTAQNLGTFVLPPRRRARVEDRPKSSPTGHRRDSVRAHRAQGHAVCAPPEADADARHRQSRRAFRGRTVLVTFAKTKVTRGGRGGSTPHLYNARDFRGFAHS